MLLQTPSVGRVVTEQVMNNGSVGVEHSAHAAQLIIGTADSDWARAGLVI